MSSCIVVEGIPGAGKTSYSKKLATSLGKDTLFLSEPDDVNNSNPYLSKYYSDPHKYAFSMQIHLLQARYKYHKLAQYHALSNIGHSIIDRSYYSDVAFARCQKDLGYFSEDEYNTYISLFEIMASNILYPSSCVFLNVDLEVAMDRINKRMIGREGRKCESSVTLDYLKMLDDKMRTVILMFKDKGVNVIEIDWNDDLSDSDIDGRIIGVSDFFRCTKSIYDRVI